MRTRSNDIVSRVKNYKGETVCQTKVVRFYETGGPEVLKIEELPLVEPPASSGDTIHNSA